jgi:hypothetical protein
VPGTRKKFKGKEKGTEAKCQEQGKNLREKRKREQKRSAKGKEKKTEAKRQEQGRI